MAKTKAGEMKKPNYNEMIKRLEEYSQNLKDNNQIGNSTLILAFIEMISAMGWSSHQQDINNIQASNLTDEIKDLKNNLKKYSESANNEGKKMRNLTYFLGAVAIFQLFIAYGQYKLGQVQTEASQSQEKLQETIWKYDMDRNDRIEARDVNWRLEDLRYQKRLP